MCVCFRVSSCVALVFPHVLLVACLFKVCQTVVVCLCLVFVLSPSVVFLCACSECVLCCVCLTVFGLSPPPQIC